MKIVWSAQALGEIERIVAHIARDDQNAAIALADCIFDATEAILSDNPNAGRPGRVAGTRELIVHASCIVAYQVGETSVDFLTVRHAARLWPEEF